MTLQFTSPQRRPPSSSCAFDFELLWHHLEVALVLAELAAAPRLIYEVDQHILTMVRLLDLPSEIRLKIWSFCVPDNVEAIVCHCFNDERVRRKCWEARQCLTIEINEDIIIPTPSILLVNRQFYDEGNSFMRPHLTLVLCRYVCTVMFLHNSTHRQRAFVDRIRLTHAIDRPQWRPSKAGSMVEHLERVLMDRLSTAAASYYEEVHPVQRLAEVDGKHVVAAEVAVRSVNLGEPISDDS